MPMSKSSALLHRIRTSRGPRVIWFFLTFNFINLSVNFSEQFQELEDPVDTISEMIYEWGFEGEADIIPDNGTEQEDQANKKVKLDWISIFEFVLLPFFNFRLSHDSNLIEYVQLGFTFLGTPPPDNR